MAAELFLAHGFVPGPRTLFAGVRKLPPATVMVVEDGRVAGRRTYWAPWEGGLPERRPQRRWEEDQEELLEHLRTAVRARMISDVPLGVMLSGGLDSSLITALMAEVSDRPVQTFSIGFAEDAGSDELPDAKRVADRLGTDHHAVTTSAADHPELLDEALWHLEEPIADVSQLGFLLLSRVAREHVTVALSGQGADELLGGYRKHEIAALSAGLHRLPRPLRRGVGALGGLAGAGSTLQRGLTAATADGAAERLLAMSRVVQPHERGLLLEPELLQDGAEEEIAAVVTRQLPPSRLSPLGETLHLDTRLALVDNMLLYFDKMSMAASLEVRVPFMDIDVVEFCWRLPDARRVWRGHRKELLKRASRGLVEDAIIDKPKRGFFHSALGAWLTVHRDALVRETLLDGRATERGQFRPGAVEALVTSAGHGDKKADQRLFCLLLLERWQRMFVDGEAPAAAAPLEARVAS
jgi:asparagine synthase (glutamine-hydrolysing)